MVAKRGSPPCDTLPWKGVASGEVILTAEIDLRVIARAKFDFDAVGHYARPDVFRLIVNTAAQTAVSYGTEFPPSV